MNLKPARFAWKQAVWPVLFLGWCHLGAGADGPDFRNVSVRSVSISENRGALSNCVVQLAFSGDALNPYMGILGTRVTRAVDDLGTDLRLDSPRPAGWGVGGDASLSPLRGWFDSNARRQRHSAVTLRAAPRTARTIKVLEGALDLYSPTLANGGVVICTNFCATPGILFSNAALAKLQIRLTCHTKASFAAAQPTRHNQLFPDLPGEPPDVPRNYLVFEVVDPDQLIVAFAFHEPGGKFLPAASRRADHGLHGFYFGTILPEPLNLYVYLGVPTAIDALPFQLENLPLP